LLRRTLAQTLQVWVVAKNHQEEFEKTGEEFEEFEGIRKGLEYYPERESKYQG
jgi:hypothetical protein